MLKGQPITTNLVSSPGSGEPAYLPADPGRVGDAITVPAGELLAVGGFVSPGDQLDMVVTIGEAVFNPAVALPRSLTRTTLRNIRVIRVGPVPEPRRAGPGGDHQPHGAGDAVRRHLPDLAAGQRRRPVRPRLSG